MRPLPVERRSAIASPRRRSTVGRIVLVIVLLAVLICVADVPRFLRPEPSAGQVELAQGWTLTSARGVTADGASVSSPGFDDSRWHSVRQMPATVLQALQDDGTYPDLYYGRNLVDEVPQDLWRQEWWYRTSFTAPGGHSTYELTFPGINYRAEIWLNGHRVAGADEIVGMYTSHDLDVTPWIHRDGANVLAVKVTPEQALQDINGVELADSWYDWINSKYLGYQGPDKNPANGNSFVADRNAGIFKPVSLRYSGAVAVQGAMVSTELALPRTDAARLTVYADVANHSAQRVRGAVRATITRAGKPDVEVEQPVELAPGQTREIAFTPDVFTSLAVTNPDLWWPYTLGEPKLYDLRVQFVQFDRVTDEYQQRFGIRTISQHRDADEQFPELGKGGNFYLTVNGRDFLVRGAVYTPDLLYKYDPERERAILSYAKDLGLNMLRLESKIPGPDFVEMADEMGIPLMVGWMCCNQWERWAQWDDEDRRVSQDSQRSQIEMLRSHPSAFIWANGSDGLAPPAVLDSYHQILSDLHWPNAVVDTVSSFGHSLDDGEPAWDGIHMAGPYSWRPPSYWFDGRYPATRGATAEQGDNERVPPLASLKSFIPPDKLWPVNDTWYFHAGSNPSNATLTSIRRAVDRRYGSSSSAEEFTRKAQLAQYESTRAQFEAFAAGGWDNHKMTIFWMLNSHWPSFFANLFDYYLRPGGAYYGAKKGLRPLSAVFDSYATGDHTQAKITVVNQTPDAAENLRVRVRVYDTGGRMRDDRTSAPVAVASGGAVQALSLPRIATGSRVSFIRCQLLGPDGTVVAENVYWQSQQRDDVGGPRNDAAFELKQVSYADMTALNWMPKAPLQVTARRSPVGDRAVTLSLRNPSAQVAFFERAEIMTAHDGDEILPVEYSDNYVTVFPGETVELRGVVSSEGPAANWVRVSGYNTAPVIVPIEPGNR